MACMRLVRRVRYNTAALPPSFFAALVSIEHGCTTAAELAARERVSAPSMSRTISELVERGYIDREQDAEDKRRMLLTVTPAGRAALAAARQERTEWMSERLETCTDQELATLREASDIINRMLGV